MDSTEANRILKNKESSELDQKIARNFLLRGGHFQNISIDLLEKLRGRMFLEIKRNPNILIEEYSKTFPILKDYRFNILYILSFDFLPYRHNQNWNLPDNCKVLSLSHFAPSPSHFTQEINFYFVDNHLKFLEDENARAIREYGSENPIDTNYRNFARSREFESGIDVYKRLENILKNQILTA